MTNGDIGKIYEHVRRGGPWGLLVFIVMFWLAQSAGYVGSEQRTANDQMRDHKTQQQDTNSKLDRIENVLRESQEKAATRDRIMCLNAAKTVEQVQRCAQIR